MTSHYNSDQTHHVPSQAGYLSNPGVSRKPPQKLKTVEAPVAQSYQGFGPLWHKTYKFRLTGTKLSPAQVMEQWKQNFSRFWPKGNNLYTPLTTITTGEIALIKSEVGAGLDLSTGMVVTQSDATSFTMLTAKGHVFAGRIAFRTYEEAGVTVAEVQSVARSADPLVEVAMLVVGHDMEDEFWYDTLTSLAHYFGVKGQVQTRQVCPNSNVHWRRVTNVRYNPLVRTVLGDGDIPVRSVVATS